MSDVTGPIRTLPGSAHAVPADARCDDHPERPATRRVQGETDSFGCEMHDLCDDCFAAMRAEMTEYRPGRCDWCKQEAADLRPRRDYDEGSTGPVYYVCAPCAERHNEEIAAESANYFDDDYDFDEYEPDEWEEASQNCHGFFDPNPETGVFACGAAGSEDCDECLMNAWCGLTNKEIDEMDDTDTPIPPSANHGESVK